MMLYPSYHDETAKTVVGGLVIPANQTAAADLKTELDALFNHPNTGPFICAQLIQRLVTSNPSPAYVYRAAQVFANDGTGVRGNLGAVVKAILLDYEARAPAAASGTGFGKLKEPLLRVTGLLRAFGGAAANGRYSLANVSTALGQAPLDSPTVFNFFDPGYVQPGGLASAGLLAPEFQITTASTAVSVPNFIYSSIYTASSPSASAVVLDLSGLAASVVESRRPGGFPEPTPVRGLDGGPDSAGDPGSDHRRSAHHVGHGRRPYGPLPCRHLARRGHSTMNKTHDLTRRNFIGRACAAVGATGFLSALAQLRMIGALAGDASPSDYKALVCLFLYGGNDSNNLLVPTDSSAHPIYAADRTMLAPLLAWACCRFPRGRTAMAGHGACIPHSPRSSSSSARVRSPCSRTRARSSSRLRSPSTMPERWRSPPQLYSHANQEVQWQSSVPDQPFTTGWGGRLADIVNALNSNPKISMSVSVAGQNSFQVGKMVSQFAVQPNGAVVLEGAGSDSVSQARTAAQHNILNLQEQNLFEAAFGGLTSRAVADSQLLASILAGLPGAQHGVSGLTSLGSQLQMIARMIQAAPSSASAARCSLQASAASTCTRTS